MTRAVGALLALAGTLALHAAPTFATTYVPVDDAVLVDRAALIVDGVISLVEDAPAGTPPAVEYRVAVASAAPRGVLTGRTPPNGHTGSPAPRIRASAFDRRTSIGPSRMR